MRENKLQVQRSIVLRNISPCGKASMTGDEGKEVTGSAQYCAINKFPSGKASMTDDEGK